MVSFSFDAIWNICYLDRFLSDTPREFNSQNDSAQGFEEPVAPSRDTTRDYANSFAYDYAYNLVSTPLDLTSVLQWISLLGAVLFCGFIYGSCVSNEQIRSLENNCTNSSPSSRRANIGRCHVLKVQNNALLRRIKAANKKWILALAMLRKVAVELSIAKKNLKTSTKSVQEIESRISSATDQVHADTSNIDFLRRSLCFNKDVLLEKTVHLAQITKRLEAEKMQIIEQYEDQVQALQQRISHLEFYNSEISKQINAAYFGTSMPETAISLSSDDESPSEVLRKSDTTVERPTFTEEVVRVLPNAVQDQIVPNESFFGSRNILEGTREKSKRKRLPYPSSPIELKSSQAPGNEQETLEKGESSRPLRRYSKMRLTDGLADITPNFTREQEDEESPGKKIKIDEQSVDVFSSEANSFSVGDLLQAPNFGPLFGESSNSASWSQNPLALEVDGNRTRELSAADGHDFTLFSCPPGAYVLGDCAQPRPAVLEYDLSPNFISAPLGAFGREQLISAKGHSESLSRAEEEFTTQSVDQMTCKELRAALELAGVEVRRGSRLDLENKFIGIFGLAPMIVSKDSFVAKSQERISEKETSNKATKELEQVSGHIKEKGRDGSSHLAGKGKENHAKAGNNTYQKKKFTEVYRHPNWQTRAGSR
eukprot:Phypoly_transcript_04035.p1 GENE.Phypoly_transcript_04035~~Phypoly_transcript_04035.p1  ORF type:complete len:654 (+),score=77.71 Phypoly_transcript_04035:154-2115(+)